MLKIIAVASAAAVGAGLLAAPVVSRADSSPDQPAYVVMAPMQPVPVQEWLASFPAAGLFARQDAALASMMSDMQALQNEMESGVPALAEVEEAGFGPAAAGRMVMVSSFSDGAGSCSRVVTYQGQGDGRAPLVNVRQEGDACGGAGRNMPGLAVSEPAEHSPAIVQPGPTPVGPKLLQIDYKHPVRPPRIHRG